MTRSVNRAAVILLAAVVAGVAPAAAQMDHSGHAMGMDMSGGWRMPPMDMEMPMLPGLQGVVPVVGAFMPGMGMDPAMLPEAIQLQQAQPIDGPVSDSLGKTGLGGDGVQQGLGLDKLPRLGFGSGLNYQCLPGQLRWVVVTDGF